MQTIDPTLAAFNQTMVGAKPAAPAITQPTSAATGGNANASEFGNTVNTPTGPTYVAQPNAPATNTGAGWTGQDGIQYGSNGLPLSSSSNSQSAGGQPQTEDQIYGNYVNQGQSIIDQINNATQAQIQAANSQIDQTSATAQQNQNAVAAITGGFGSSSAAGATQVSATANSQKQTADSQIRAQQSQQVSQYLQSLQTAAENQANFEVQNYPEYDAQVQQNKQQLQTAATSTLQGLAKMGVSVQSLQQQAAAGNTNAQTTLQNLMTAYGGDQNALNAASAMATPVPNVVQSFTNGSTFNQIVRDPSTNAISVQSFDLGMSIPTGWTSNKVSTNTLMMQDPNNPGNTVIYTTNPLTGEVQVTGTGTGQALASQYGGSSGASDSSGSSQNASSTGVGTGAANISSILGVDPTMPFSDVSQNVGIGSIVSAITQNEGGSPSGVKNNPGNVKYAGLPGQVDSGVKATDGGTFASYKTPDEGTQAIASVLTDIAQKQGPDATLSSVVGTYTGTGAQQPDGTGSNGLPTSEYGLLSNVQGFDPTGKNSDQPTGIDSAAFNYLKEYLTQGKTPTAASVGVSTRAGSGALFNTISNRASDVYYQATGQQLPDLNVLTANKKLLTGNNSILNNLSLQENTIKANSDLYQKNITAANINDNAPAINNVINGFLNYWQGNPDVASQVAQSSTLSNELGSLLALKNASGTTVHDKLESAGLINKDSSAAQEAAVVNTLMQEAQNGRTAIGKANADIYQQIDPLGLQPSNPINQPGYQEMTAGGATNNYDGTWTLNGNTVKVNKDGTVSPV